MPQFSGSFSGKSNSQAVVALKDVPGHELSLIEVSGGGTYQGPITSPTEVEVSWEGSYQLG